MRIRPSKTILASSVFLILFLVQVNAATAYTITRYFQTNWYDGKWDNSWASTAFDSSNDRFRMKAWTWLDILDGKAKMWWDSGKGPSGFFNPDATGTANVKVHWTFSGELRAKGNGYLRFTYTVYRYSGGQEYPVPMSGNVITYTDDSRSFNNEGQDHTFTATLSAYIIYYIKCEIYLYQDKSSSDFYDGSNGLIPEWVEMKH